MLESIINVVSAHSKTDKYVDAVAKTLKQNWPSAPKAIFITDGGVFLVGPKIAIPGESWVTLQRKAIEKIKADHPHVTHIFFLIEDHCPLRGCDADLIFAYFSRAMTENYAYVMFPTFEWPWERKRDIDPYVHGRDEGASGFDVVHHGNLDFAAIPRGFFRYFSVQPTLWNLNYLLEVCGQATSQGISDAWHFEAMLWDDARQHYVANYRWPTVHHGFLVKGQINPNAIAFMDSGRAQELRKLLLHQIIGINSMSLFKLFKLYCAFERRAFSWTTRFC